MFAVFRSLHMKLMLILLLGVVREYLGGFAPALALSSVCVLLLLLWGRSITWQCREE